MHEYSWSVTVTQLASSTHQDLPVSSEPRQPPAGRSSLTHAISLGAWAYAQVQRDFTGSVDSRTRALRPTLRELVGRSSRALSVSTVWRGLQIYRLSLRFPELTEYSHLGVGHLSVILGIPEAVRLDWLRAAEKQRWSRRQLAREVARAKAHNWRAHDFDGR